MNNIYIHSLISGSTAVDAVAQSALLLPAAGVRGEKFLLAVLPEELSAPKLLPPTQGSQFLLRSQPSAACQEQPLQRLMFKHICYYRLQVLWPFVKGKGILPVWGCGEIKNWGALLSSFPCAPIKSNRSHFLLLDSLYAAEIERNLHGRRPSCFYQIHIRIASYAREIQSNNNFFESSDHLWMML